MKKYLQKNKLRYWRFLVWLKIYKYFKNIVEENIDEDETRNYLLQEIDQNEFMSRKHKQVCTTINYIEHFLVLASTITGYISTSPFASLLGIPIGIASSAIGLKMFAITGGIKKYMSKIRKRKRSMIKWYR